MSKVAEIKKLIERLSHSEVWQLSDWLMEYRQDRWDQQIEEDAKAGRLDKLFEQALEDLRAGRTRPLWSPAPSSRYILPRQAAA